MSSLWARLHETGWVALERPRPLVKRNTNQLCDNMTTEPARLAGIVMQSGPARLL